MKFTLAYPNSSFTERAVRAICECVEYGQPASSSVSSVFCDCPCYATELAAGIDKTYIYLQTIHELYRRHGWQKYLIVVPNLALRERVAQVLSDTLDHFAVRYQIKPHFFVYDSGRLNDLRQFINERHLGIMVISAQAFNVRSDGLRKIRDPLDSFGLTPPMQQLSALHPIIILDEPQRILGRKRNTTITQSCLAEFHPRFFLSYSSQHDSVSLPSFRFTADDAARERLIKTPTLQIVKKSSVTATRRQQIRQTIRAHLETEARLFARGIKVLSLFFVDDVANFRIYEELGESLGLYARFFEAEYSTVLREFLARPLPSDFRRHITQFPLTQTYTGHFSINKLTQQLKNSALNPPSESASEIDTYRLIRHEQAKLLRLDNPVRFIFTHSGLHEGWDNPNIFQICPLHAGSTSLRSQSELNRGLPICVDQFGVRQTYELLGNADFADVNRLRLIVGSDYAEKLGFTIR